MTTCCVIPSVRPHHLKQFKEAWKDLFAQHRITLVVVVDGEEPRIEVDGVEVGPVSKVLHKDDQNLIFNRTDSVRSAGFLWAAEHLKPDTFTSFDDDVMPLPGEDALADLLAPLRTHVSISWLNTLLGGEAYVRGFPYKVRAEAQVQVSHAGWVTTPDYDAPTQLYLTPQSITNPEKYSKPKFFVGPVPKGVNCCWCGMAVAFTKEAAPFVYYAPMGHKVDLHRFGDIWCGLSLKRACDERNWAIYYGNAIVNHSRASDVFKNLAQEAEGLRLNEDWWEQGDSIHPYFPEYKRLREQFQTRMTQLLGLP